MLSQSTQKATPRWMGASTAEAENLLNSGFITFIPRARQPPVRPAPRDYASAAGFKTGNRPS